MGNQIITNNKLSNKFRALSQGQGQNWQQGGNGKWPNGDNVTIEINKLIDGTNSITNSYCANPESIPDIPGSLPNNIDATQKLYKPNPYGPASCSHYAVVRKPKMHPGILRGKLENEIGWCSYDSNSINASPMTNDSVGEGGKCTLTPADAKNKRGNENQNVFERGCISDANCNDLEQLTGKEFKCFENNCVQMPECSEGTTLKDNGKCEKTENVSMSCPNGFRPYDKQGGLEGYLCYPTPEHVINNTGANTTCDKLITLNCDGRTGGNIKNCEEVTNNVIPNGEICEVGCSVFGGCNTNAGFFCNGLNNCQSSTGASPVCPEGFTIVNGTCQKISEIEGTCSNGTTGFDKGGRVNICYLNCGTKFSPCNEVFDLSEVGGVADPTRQIEIKGEDLMKYGFIIGGADEENPETITRLNEIWDGAVNAGINQYYPNSCECGNHTSVNWDQANKEIIKSSKFNEKGVANYDINETSLNRDTMSARIPDSDISDAHKENITNEFRNNSKCEASQNLDPFTLSDSSNNACGQYIKKWSKTCEWCNNINSNKENLAFNPGDEGWGCKNNTDCLSGVCGPNKETSNKFIGHCKFPGHKISPIGNKPLYCNTQNDCPLLEVGTSLESRAECIPYENGVCEGINNLDCSICDSSFWDHIPGGLDAVLDENNALHEIATLSYIPHIQYTDEFSLSCSQPNYQDINGNDARLCCAGFQTDGCGGTENDMLSDLNLALKQNACTSNGNGLCDQNSTCSRIQWDDVKPDGNSAPGNRVPISESAWSGIDGRGNSADNLIGSCPKQSSGILTQQTMQFRLMCEKNPALSRIGSSNKQNEELAINWINGDFDLTKFNKNGESIGVKNDPRVTEEDKKKREIEALRCCLGLTPGYISSENSVNNTTREDCPAASVCPSSDFCKNLYTKAMNGELKNPFEINDFAEKYPGNYSLNGSTGLSEEIMSSPALYTKAYCEMMSGGELPGVSNSFGYDKDINTNCRKLMYNYCTTPVTLLVNDVPDASLLSQSEYSLPARIFTQPCQQWCVGGGTEKDQQGLSQVMPDQYGVCDMMMGSSCQQMQTDGWFNKDMNPEETINNINLSGTNNFLNLFTDSKGHFTDTNGITYTMASVEEGLSDGGARSIKDSCGCFLTGGQCTVENNEVNCSYFYCGAGTEAERGPNPVKINWN